MLQTLFGLNGRLTRTGFWEVLISVMLLDVAAAVAAITALEHAFPGGQVIAASQVYEIVRWSLLAVAVLSVWAIFAAHVKRAHDRGRGAGFLLWVLLPVVGWLWLLYDLGFKGGDFSRNRFGAPPLGHGDLHHAGEHDLSFVSNDHHHGQDSHGGHADRHGHADHGGHTDHGHHGHHDDTPPPTAELDWTGDASEDSARAAAHYRGHYDAGEALMQASEHSEAPPHEAAPPHATLPSGHPDAHAPHDGHDDLSAAMGAPHGGGDHSPPADPHHHGH